MENLPFWRNIYKGVNVKCKTVNPKYVSDTLAVLSNDILTGLLVYKPYTTQSLTEWKKVNKNKRLETLINKISIHLNLECRLGYTLFCNYLMFEFYGKVEDIEEIARIDTYVTILLKRMWAFYTSERMYYLKTVRYIIENSSDTQHKALTEFIGKHTMKVITDSLLKQYDYLLHEIQPRQVPNCLSLKDWLKRNNVEQMEVLATLMHCANTERFSVETSVTMLRLFTEHGFGTNPVEYFEAVAISDQQDLQNVLLLENTVFIVAAKHYWYDDSWFDEMNKFDEIFIDKLNLITEQPMIILCFCMLVSRQPSENFETKYNMEHFRKLLEISFTNHPFEQMVSTLEIPLLKGSSTESILQDALWEFLNQLCLRVDNVFQIQHKPDSIRLLALLMEVPELCLKTLDQNHAINLLFSATIHMFPQDFNSFCILYAVTLKHKDFQKKVVTSLNQLEVYSEECPYTRLESYILTNDFKTENGVVIPKNAEAKIVHLDKMAVIQYRGHFTYSFFGILNKYLCQILNEYEDSFTNELEIVQNCINGLHLVTELIKVVPEHCNIPEIRSCLSHGIHLYTEVVTYKKPTFILIKHSFKLCTDLILLGSLDRYHKLKATQSLPTVFSHYNIEELLKGSILGKSDIIDVIVREKVFGHYSILHIYLNLWIHTYEESLHLQEIHLPCTVFFLQEVFPQHLNWNYTDLCEKNSISLKIVTYLAKALQMSGDMEDKTSNLIYNFCVETIFNYIPFINSFITILRMGNGYIERVTCNELHWNTNRCSDLILTLRTSLSIVLWMFNLKSLEEIKATQFWKQFLYTGPNVCSIVKTICEYINHQFDPILPKLALSLLRKISQDSTVPVLACLEMDNYQVECMFLERLRDPLEQMELKVGILELMIICLKNQDGMTAAFFNLVGKRKLHSSERVVKPCDETVVGYFYEYLENISLAQVYMRGPIQAAMLELLHTLWMEKRTVLVTNLLEKDNFWQIMINPLIQDYTLDDKTYGQILEILGMEICKDKINTKLEDVLKYIFSTNDLGKKFPAHLRDIFRENRNSNSIYALKAWTKFIVFIVKFCDNLIDEDIKKSLVTSTIEGLLSSAEEAANNNVVLSWCDLYLYLITHWGRKCYAERNQHFELVANTFGNVANFFSELGKKGKETFVAIAIKTIEHFGDIFETCSWHVQKFLNAMKSITNFEYDLLLIGFMHRKEPLYIDHIVFVLIVIFGTKLLPHELCLEWFSDTQLLQKVVTVLPHFANHRETLILVKIMIRLLTGYVMSPLCEHFLHVDILEMFNLIKFPNEYFDCIKKHETEGYDVSFQEDFWLTYTSIINFNLRLIERLKLYVMTPMLTFFQIYQKEIIKIIKLPSVTVSVIALKLVSHCLRFSDAVLAWNFSQTHFFDPMYHDYIKIVAECFNTCVNILLRPQVLRIFKMVPSFRLVTAEHVPVKFMVDIMNRIIEIIGSSCLVLLGISSPITDMFSHIQSHIPSYLDIEQEFHAPIPINPNQDLQKLTFGGILCLGHYMCKTLLQILAPKEDIQYLDYVSMSTYLIEPSDQVDIEDRRDQIYAVFVYPDFNDITLGHDKFNSIQRFANSEIYSLSAPWMARMNHEQMSYVLEIVNTLLLSQVYGAILKIRSNPVQSQILKRDLCSELQFFHEFVRKKLVDQETYYIEGNLILKTKTVDCTFLNYETFDNDYLIMLSHLFMIICDMIW